MELGQQQVLVLIADRVVGRKLCELMGQLAQGLGAISAGSVTASTRSLPHIADCISGNPPASGSCTAV